MARVLAVKVGNAEAMLGLFEGEELLGTWAVAARSVSTANEAVAVVRTFLTMREAPSPDDGIVCSVAPLRTMAWVEGLRDLTGKRPLLLGPGLKSGIAMGYKDPGQMGADRVAAAVAAKGLRGAPVIVVDFGTTTTLTVVGQDGGLLGGVIAPGLRTSLDALSQSAAQLAEVTMLPPKTVIGRTTADAVRSGVVFGEAARVDMLVQDIWDELGYETALVATGRYAQLVCGVCKHDFQIQDDLVLQGLRMIYDLNRKGLRA